MGTDCSGIEAPLHALQQLGVPHTHVFSSEICPTVRRQLLANHRPQILYEDVITRDNSSAPYVDLYVAGWPCHGNSTLGKRRGLADPRTRVIWSLLDYIHKQRPNVVVLENVANALHIGRGEQFNGVRSSLEGAGYFVHWRILCPKDVGVPMHRRRLYIVAVRKDVQTALQNARSLRGHRLEAASLVYWTLLVLRHATRTQLALQLGRGAAGCRGTTGLPTRRACASAAKSPTSRGS